MTVIFILTFSIVVHLLRGGYGPVAPFLTLAFFYWVYQAVAARTQPRLESIILHCLRWFPVVFVSYQVFNPGVVDLGSSELNRYRIFLWIILALQFLIAWVGRRMYPLARLWLQGSLFLFGYCYSLSLLPDPNIDVFRSNDLAVGYFLRGLNPYSGTYPDIYAGNYDYTPGFLYWPVTLYMQAFSKFVFNDIRVILVLFWWSVPFGFSRIRKGHDISDLASTWWSLPFLNFGFQQAWIDPMLLGLAGWSFSLILKSSRRVPLILLALTAGAKQYGGIIGFYYSLFLLRNHSLREVSRRLLGAGFVFGMTLLPWLIWNFDDFWSMTVQSHIHAQVRRDALNFSSFWWRITGAPAASWTQLLAVMTGILLSVAHAWRNSNRIGLRVVPEACAITFGFSMFFGKFAFCNYYWFLIGLWLLAEFIALTAKNGDALPDAYELKTPQ